MKRVRRFPAWLGQNSSAGKQRRLLGALHTKMTASGNMHADRTGLRISYLPAFRPALTTPLLREGKEGIPDIIALLHVSLHTFQPRFIVVQLVLQLCSEDVK